MAPWPLDFGEAEFFPTMDPMGQVFPNCLVSVLQGIMRYHGISWDIGY